MMLLTKLHTIGYVSLNESRIHPQLDGVDDNIVTRDTYCRVCKECPDEIETSEDISAYSLWTGMDSRKKILH